MLALRSSTGLGVRTWTLEARTPLLVRRSEAGIEGNASQPEAHSCGLWAGRLIRCQLVSPTSPFWGPNNDNTNSPEHPFCARYVF